MIRGFLASCAVVRLSNRSSVTPKASIGWASFNYLARQQGDATNAVLAAAGYNFRRLLAWLALSLFGIAARHTANGYVAENQPIAA